MPAIRFDASMYVGIREIDSQHEKLTAMINDLYQAYMNGKEKSVLAEVISGINKYADYHFATEEELMLKYEYPSAPGHKGLHQEFTTKALEFLADYVKGKEEISAEVLDYLTDWWINHITKTDKSLGAFLKEKGLE